MSKLTLVGICLDNIKMEPPLAVLHSSEYSNGITLQFDCDIEEFNRTVTREEQDFLVLASAAELRGLHEKDCYASKCILTFESKESVNSSKPLSCTRSDDEPKITVVEIKSEQVEDRPLDDDMGARLATVCKFGIRKLVNMSWIDTPRRGYSIVYCDEKCEYFGADNASSTNTSSTNDSSTNTMFEQFMLCQDEVEQSVKDMWTSAISSRFKSQYGHIRTKKFLFVVTWGSMHEKIGPAIVSMLERLDVESCIVKPIT